MNPWDAEPNQLDFEADGLPCAMRRGWSGVWCGYVGIGQDHPWFGLSHNTLIKPTRAMLDNRTFDDTGVFDLFMASISGKNPHEELEIAMALRVHGGITYSADHIVEPEVPAGFFWYGFDCGHAGDYMPAMARRFPGLMDGAVYRDQQFVVSECQSLAAQLVKIKETFPWQTVKLNNSD